MSWTSPLNRLVSPEVADGKLTPELYRGIVYTTGLATIISTLVCFCLVLTQCSPIACVFPGHWLPTSFPQFVLEKLTFATNTVIFGIPRNRIVIVNPKRGKLVSCGRSRLVGS